MAPGERFITERQAKLLWAPNSPEKQEFEHLMHELTKRGVHEEIARDLVYAAKDLPSVRLRIEYVDSEIRRRSRSRNPIKNPPGFYKWFIENEVPVPGGLVSAATATAAAQAADLQNEYLNYRYREAEKYFKDQYTTEQQRDRLEEMKYRLRKDSDEWAYLPPNVLETMVYHHTIQEVESEVELLTYDQFCQNNQLRLALA